MRCVLVTGGAGFIGTNLVRFWRRRHCGDNVIVLDRLGRGGRRENLPEHHQPNFHFYEGDVRDFSLIVELLERHDIDTVIHLAAETHVDRSITAPLEFVQHNVLGTATLLEAMRRVWLRNDMRERHLHVVSTDEVFGSLLSDSAPAREDAPYRPTSPYAASKAAADMLTRGYAQTYGLSVSLTYSSNNYGPYQDPEKLIPRFIARTLEGRSLPLFADGSNVRDWLYVDDHCGAIETVVSMSSARSKVFNVSAGQARSNLDLARLLCAAIDSAFVVRPALKEIFPEAPPARGRPCATSIELVTDRVAHDFRYAIDAASLTEHTGYTAQTILGDGIAKTVEWYLINYDWLKRSDAPY